jgi:transposase
VIVIGIDPHKHVHAAAVVDTHGRVLASCRLDATAAAEQLPGWAAAQGAQRLWAIEDCRSYSRQLERALLAAGERVVRVAPRLTAAVRGRGRQRGKSDNLDAVAVARAALREPNLPPAQLDERRRELRLLRDHRQALVRERTGVQNRLRELLHELDPTLAPPPRSLSRRRPLERLATALAQQPAGVLRQLSEELLDRCHALNQRIDELEHELADHVRATAPTLLALPGCGTLTAATILAELDIRNFHREEQLALHAGTAPLPASSGQHTRHRLNRGGNRRLNSALHLIAITQASHHPPARAYLNRLRTNGKTRREALRCLKRHLVRTIYQRLQHDATNTST